jgi:hypothetical protein
VKFSNSILKLTVLATFLFPVTLLVAQNNYTAMAAGINYGFPKLQKNYSTTPWKGVHIRATFLEFGYMAGRVTKPNDETALGYNAYLGANIPFTKLEFGKREYGIKGFLVVPFMAGDLGLTGIDGRKSFQLTAAPGISLQLPYTLIDFRLNTSFAFNNVPGLLKYKVLFAPTIAFQFDGLWDVMDPHLEFDGHYEGVNSSTTYSDHVETTSTEIITTTTATTTYTPYSSDVYRFDVGPYITLGPRMCYWNLKKGNTCLMAGIVQSGRAHGFGYDLIAEKGTIKTETGYSLKATRTIGRLSFDFNIGKTGNTHFSRLMIGGGLGYNWFQQSDAHVHSDNGQFMNLFIAYEIGAVSFSFEKNYAFYNAFDTQKYFTFTYSVPFERVAERYKQLRQSR